MMVAVGFRNVPIFGFVAERRLKNAALSIDAPRRTHLIEPIRGLKPTATVSISLRETRPARALTHRRNVHRAFPQAPAGGTGARAMSVSPEVKEAAETGGWRGQAVNPPAPP